MKDNAGSMILVALAIFGFVSPIVFGFIVFKLQQNFVSISKYEADLEHMENQRIEDNRRSEKYREEMLVRVEKIDTNVMVLVNIKAAQSGRR